MTPSEAMQELISQHDNLREIMDHCADLMDSLDSHPQGDPRPLTQQIAKLRAAFDVHNTYEERLLKPTLLAHDLYGTLRVERMVNDHVQEHGLIGARLGSPAIESLRDVIETLRAHLEAEERYLLSPQALRVMGETGA
ncbi:hypothetical protein BH11MYX2_BH11MYX2_10090 [soil metagenome]